MSNTQERNNMLKNVAKGAGFLLVGLIISRVFAFLTRVVLARFLGPEDYGLIYLGISVFYLIIPIVLLGLPRTVERYVSFYNAKKDYGRVKGTITSALKLSFPVSILLLLIIFLGADWISIIFLGNTLLGTILKIISISLPFMVILRISLSGIRGFQTIKYDALIHEIFKSSITFILIVCFLIGGIGVVGGIMGYSIGFILSGILAFYFLEKKIFPIIKTKIKSVDLRGKLLSFSLPILFLTFIWIIIGQIDTIMIGGLTKSTKLVGIYQAALPTAELMFIVPLALSSLFLPIISDLYSKNKKEDIQYLYKAISKWIFYLNLPFFALFLIFPKVIINFLFGSEYFVGWGILSILSFGFLISSFSRLSVGIIDMLGKTKYHLLNSIILIFLDVVLNYILIPIYGIYGAAIATAATFLVFALITIIEAKYFFNVYPININLLKSLASVIISGTIIYFITTIFESLSFYLVFGLIIVFFFLYGFLILLFKGIGSEDIMILKSIENKTGIKIEFLRNLIKRFL